MSIYVHLADGFEEIEAVTIVDVLRRAGLDVKIVAVGKETTVRGAHGICMTADMLLEQAEYAQAEMLILPGGMPGTLNLMESERLCQALTEAFAQGRWVAAICAAPMVLGHLSLTEGKRATIYPGMEEHLTGAAVCSDAVVRDGNLVTSKGPGTAMEFSLKLVELLSGSQMAENLKKEMIVAYV